MQNDDSPKDQDESVALKAPAPDMSDIKPAEPAVSDAPVVESSGEVPLATPPKDDVMPDLASEASPPAEAVPAHEAPAAPSAADAVKKKGGMGMVIAIVAVVVVALAAVGYFALVKKDKTATSGNPSSTQAATKADPGAAATEIDNGLSTLDQAKDFNSADLSDTALGL